jgi:hypothetical protein
MRFPNRGGQIAAGLVAALGSAFAADAPDVRQALDYIAAHEAAQVGLQVKLSEIPAP